MSGIILRAGGPTAASTPQTGSSTQEGIAILRMDANWRFNSAGKSFSPIASSDVGGESSTGALEFGYFFPTSNHSKIWLTLSGGLAADPDLKSIDFLAESGSVLASYDLSDLQGNLLVNDGHTHWRYWLPLHTSKEKFSIRITDNDVVGTNGPWSWIGVLPETTILAV